MAPTVLAGKPNPVVVLLGDHATSLSVIVAIRKRVDGYSLTSNPDGLKPWPGAPPRPAMPVVYRVHIESFVRTVRGELDKVELEESVALEVNAGTSWRDGREGVVEALIAGQSNTTNVVAQNVGTETRTSGAMFRTQLQCVVCGGCMVFKVFDKNVH